MIDIVIMMILVVGITLVTVSWLRRDLKCPPPQIIYRYIPKHTLDVQFGEENLPSEVYKDMFTKSTPWIGGYNAGNRRVFMSVNTTSGSYSK